MLKLYKNFFLFYETVFSTFNEYLQRYNIKKWTHGELKIFNKKGEKEEA